MKAADADILIVPGYTGSDTDHWQSRWERGMRTAARVEQADWDRPDRRDWAATIVAQAKASTRPVVIVAHSCGVLASVDAAPALEGVVRAAFLVTPPDVASPALPEPCRVFAPTPTDPLPFPSVVVASRTDPVCALAVAEDLAAAWGSLLLDAGDVGHLNAASGHGPWPEGLLAFATMMGRLG